MQDLIIDENYDEDDPRRYKVKDTSKKGRTKNSTKKKVVIPTKKEWKRQRLTDLSAGILAAIDLGINIDSEWVEEYNELINEMESDE